MNYIPDDDPRLDIKTISGREFMDATETAVRTLSRSKKTEVVYEGSGMAATDGNTVFLPAIPETTELTRREHEVGRGYANHETLHILLTDMPPTLEKYKEWVAGGRQFTKDLANGIEDVRIEKGGCKLYPGLPKSLNQTSAECARDFLKRQLPEAGEEILQDAYAMLPLVVSWEGRRLAGYPNKWMKACLDKIPPEIRAFAGAIAQKAIDLPDGVQGLGRIDKAEAHRGSRMALELAEEISDHIHKQIQQEAEKQKQQEQAQQGQGEGDSPGEPADCAGDQEQDEAGQGQAAQPADPAGEENSGEQGGSEKGKSESQTENQKAAEPEGPQDEQDGSGEEKAKQVEQEAEQAEEAEQEEASPRAWEQRSLDPGVDKTAHHILGGIGKGDASAWRRYSTRMDSIKKKNFAKKRGMWEDEYKRHLRELSSNIATTKRKLQKAMIGRSDTEWSSGYRSGRLDVRSRGRDILLGNENVFRRRTEAEALDTCVMVLVDCSGSMNGNKIDLATRACIVLTEAIDRLDVPVQVVSFTATKGIRPDGEDANQKWESTVVLRMRIYKEFDQSILRARAGLASLSGDAHGSTPETEALIWAVGEIKKRPESQKILLVLNDGSPTYHSHWSVAKGSLDTPEAREEHRRLRRNYKATRLVIEYAELQGIRTVGIGIMSTSVQKFYPRWAVVNTVDDLPNVVIGEVARLILGKTSDARGLIHATRSQANAVFGMITEPTPNLKPPYPSKMSIPATWFQLAPGQGMRFWQSIYRICTRRRINRYDLDAVQQVVNEKL